MAGHRPPSRRSRLAVLFLTLWPFLLLVALEAGLRLVGAFEGPWDPAADPAPRRNWSGLKIDLDPSEDAVRVFTLGGSATEGYGVDTTFTDVLATRLAEARPDVRWRVINAGRGAAGSRMVLDMGQQALAYDPHVLVVYAGHNEFLEPIYFQTGGALDTVSRWQAMARRSRVLRMIHSVVPLDLEPPRRLLPAGARASFAARRIASDEAVPAHMAALRDRLTQLTNEAQAAGVAVVLVPAVPNLLFPPSFAVSVTHPDAPAPVPETVAAATMCGYADRVSLSDLRGRLDADPRNANLWFDRGVLQLCAGDVAGARQSLRRAVTEDRGGDRATDAVRDVFAEVAAETGATRLDLMDAYTARLPEELAGWQPGGATPLFLDHCHPTRAGHAWLAEQILPVVRTAVPPGGS